MSQLNSGKQTSVNLKDNLSSQQLNNGALTLNLSGKELGDPQFLRQFKNLVESR